MEKVCRIKNQLLLSLFSTLLFLGCSTKSIMEDTKNAPNDIDAEYGQVVRVKDIKNAPVAQDQPNVVLPMAEGSKPKESQPKEIAPKLSGPQFEKVIPKKAASLQQQLKPAQSAVQSTAKKRLPDIEDSTGFIGRRPVADPFRAGERVTLSAKYLNIEAGDVVLSVLPFKEVNARKAYHLKMNIKTNKTFNFFYAVDNTSETFLDYDDLIPQTFTYDAKESSRIREYKIFFDLKKNEATQWKREVHKKKGEKKNKIQWAIEPYSQNILSALFYLRVFQLSPGQKYSFRVADEGKNYIFTFHVLRREVIDTALGRINTLVIRPDFMIDGVLKPSGENTLWVTDDHRKFIVQIAAKVKIGTFMLKLKSIEGPN